MLLPGWYLQWRKNDRLEHSIHTLSFMQYCNTALKFFVNAHISAVIGDSMADWGSLGDNSSRQSVPEKRAVLVLDVSSAVLHHRNCGVALSALAVAHLGRSNHLSWQP